MAVVLDPHGTAWSVHRDWWPFPGDILDFTDLFELVIGAFFLVLWPFWFLAKFVGVRWVIVVERDGHQTGRELVRGWKRSQRRINELAHQIATGDRSGHYTI